MAHPAPSAMRLPDLPECILNAWFWCKSVCSRALPAGGSS